MPIKLLFYSIGLFICFQAVGQSYDRFCGCLPPSMFKFDSAGHHILPEDHPSAKYFNDPKHWYWKNVSREHPEFGGFWEVKSEYMDSIEDGRGGWIKAAFWTVERWKEEEKNKEERKKQLLDEFLRFDEPVFKDSIPAL